MTNESLLGDLLILFSILLIRFLIWRFPARLYRAGALLPRLSAFGYRLYGALKPLLMGLEL